MVLVLREKKERGRRIGLHVLLMTTNVRMKKGSQVSPAGLKNGKLWEEWRDIGNVSCRTSAVFLNYSDVPIV